jgi:hypothetical protein
LGKGECVGWLDAGRYVYFDPDYPAYMVKEIDGGITPILVGNVWQIRSYDNLIFYPPLKK